jgi:peroxiredoxin
MCNFEHQRSPIRPTRRRFSTAILLAIGQFATSTGTAGGSAEDESAARGKVRAPEFRLQASDGSLRRLQDYRGKLLLLNFWATWCPPCRIEMPVFSAAQRKWKDRGVSIVGVAMDGGGWRTITPFIRQNPVSYEILLGTPQVARAYGAGRIYPTTVVVDPEGYIVGLFETALEADDLDTLLEKLTSAINKD